MSWWMLAPSIARARYVPDVGWNPVWETEYILDGEGNVIEEITVPPAPPDSGDNDGDNLPNWHEIYLGTSFGMFDTDGDGAGDGDEVYTMGTDPLDYDSDDNGVGDLDQWLASRPPLITNSPSISLALNDDQTNVPLTAEYGGGGYSWSVTNGALPSGTFLQADPGSGTTSIVGRPSAVGAFPVTLSVLAANGLSSSLEVTFVVNPPPPPLSISTSSPLGAGTIHQGYSAPLEAANGSPPYDWSLAEGSLPPGLALAPGAAEISGTPTQIGTFAFTIRVTDNDGATATTEFQLAVNDPVEGLGITTESLPPAYPGVPYEAHLSAANGTSPYSWSLDGTSQPLPSGLSLASNGTISGTPDASTGTWNCTFSVTDEASASASRTVSLEVTAQPPDNDGDGLNAALEAELSAELGIAMDDTSQTSNPHGYNDWFVWYFTRAYTDDVGGDTDGDGLGPVLEARLGTTEGQRDSDGDFRPDWWLYYEQVLSFSDTTDADGDGLHFQLEELIGTSDSSQDSDTDTLSDVQEWQNIAFSDPARLDTDGEGLWDAVEAALGTQARMRDTDGDYLTDAEETGVFASLGLNPTLRDTDGDGEPDYYEADLTDTDGGGIPDLMEQVWLMDPSNPVDETWDADGDDLTNVEEYHLGFDIRTDFYNQHDFDADGMTNIWEIAHGFNPRDWRDAAEDPDGDWWFNVEEYRNATDPRTANLPPTDGNIASLARHTDGTQWDADWDGDGILNWIELAAPSNPRAQPPPPACACVWVGHATTPCGCMNSAGCTNGSCLTITPPTCGCQRVNCPGTGCGSYIASTGNCLYCSYPPPSHCSCGRCTDSANCPSSMKDSSCTCNTAVPCTQCSNSACVGKSGGTCSTAGPGCNCGGGNDPPPPCPGCVNSPPLGTGCPGAACACNGTGGCGQVQPCDCAGTVAGSCNCAKKGDCRAGDCSCNCGHGYCRGEGCTSAGPDGCTCDYDTPNHPSDGWFEESHSVACNVAGPWSDPPTVYLSWMEYRVYDSNSNSYQITSFKELGWVLRPGGNIATWTTIAGGGGKIALGSFVYNTSSVYAKPWYIGAHKLASGVEYPGTGLPEIVAILWLSYDPLTRTGYSVEGSSVEMDFTLTVRATPWVVKYVAPTSGTFPE